MSQVIPQIGFSVSQALGFSRQTGVYSWPHEQEQYIDAYASSWEEETIKMQVLSLAQC